jgi:hypothetical protein
MLHTVTKTNIFNEPKINTFSKLPTSLVFTFNNLYSDTTFQNIIPDSGAAGVSTTRKPQVVAFQKLDPIISIDTSIAGNHKIRFGKGEAVSIGTIQVGTPLGNIRFHMLLTNTLFLYCLQDMDRMKVKLDNIQNMLV